MGLKKRVIKGGKMREYRNLYLIRWTGSDGQESLVAITDDLDKWLEYNNSERGEEEQETLTMFNIEQIETHLFEEEK